ncbi:MAG: PD40 domain-containing protein [Planctomycetes bacterium]|nr:PD40 domain-containing protein [Planctomycetota bacterium]
MRSLPILLRSQVLLVAVLLSCAVARSAEPSEKPAITRLTRTYYPKFFLRYSPDGSQITFSRHHRNSRGTNQILVGLRIMKADGTGDRPLLSEFDSKVQIQEHASWSPDGRRLAISGGGNDTGNSSKDTFVCDIDQDFQATNLRKLAAGEGVTMGEEPCVSPDGKYLAFVSVDETLWTADADGKNKTRVIQVDGQYCHQPEWSPDGEWIAFASDRDGNVEIYKVRWDGTDLARLTTNASFDCRPRWSRDGQLILFTSNRDGNHNLFLMDADGGDVQPLTTDLAMDDHGDWSPDGRSIAFVSMRDGGFDVYRLTLPRDIKIGPAPVPKGPSVVLPGDLVAWYDFDQTSDGELVRDKAGRNHLRLIGANVVSADGHGALEFDGKENHAVAGNGAALRIGGALTISFWVRPSKFGGNGYLISKYGWNVYIGSDGIPRFESRTAANSAWDTLPANRPLKPAKWSFVAMVFDPKSEKLLVYLDGELSAERERRDGALGAVDAYPLQLGQYTASNTQSFAGKLDEIRIYARALPAESIRQEFTKQKEAVVSAAP